MSELNTAFRQEVNLTTPPAKVPLSVLRKQAAIIAKRIEEAENIEASNSSSIISHPDASLDATLYSKHLASPSAANHSISNSSFNDPQQNPKTETYLINSGKELLSHLSNFLKLTVDSIKYSKDLSSNIIAFLIGVSNSLSASSIPTNLWTKTVLSFLGNSPLALHFIEHNSLPSVVQHTIWSNRKILHLADIASWSFDLLCKELFALFKNERFLQNVQTIVSSWNMTSFNNFKLAVASFETLMSQASFFHAFTYSQTPLTFIQLCELNRCYLWNTLSPAFLKDFTAWCLHYTGLSPMSAMNEVPYALLRKTISEYVKSISDLSALNEPLKNPPASSNKSINMISSPMTSDKQCSFCGKPGHLDSACFAKNPALLTAFHASAKCNTCGKRGHSASVCRSAS